jgi:hypothetical protein
MVDEGLLIRGALLIGPLERTYGALFGPGLISAYDLEREHARFPRIVVDAGLFEALKSERILRHHEEYNDEMEYISNFVRQDDDGVFFIDYLGGMQSDVNHPAD